MKYITLSELLGYKIRKIQTGSELLLIYELNKYCNLLLDAKLTIEDTTIVREVILGEHFAFVYNNTNMNLNYEKGQEEFLADYKSTSRKYFTRDVLGVVFAKKDDNIWVYRYDTDRDANLIMNGYDRSAAYVSLYAFMVVSCFRDKKPLPKLRIESTNHDQPEMEYVDLLILQYYGNKLLLNKVEIQYGYKILVQPEWEAFIMYNRQLGYMLTESNAQEKFKYAQKHFKVGDVVLYYKKDKKVQTKSIRKLLECYPAVIDNITKEGIKLTYYPIIETRLTRRRKLEEVERSLKDDFKYSIEDYLNFPKCELFLDYADLGVDVLSYVEDFMILKLMKGTDTTIQHIVADKNEEKSVELDTLNTIYAVFEDRGVKYNKERFLELHFKKEKPIYDILKHK